MAIWHGMAPLLASYVALLAEPVAQSTKDALGKLYRKSLRHNLFLSKHLFAALGALAANGVSAIPFKGPALSLRLYGDIALRQCSDLDIIVRPRDMVTSLETLQKLGFAPTRRLAPNQLQALREQDFEVELELEGVHLDLHWGVMPTFYALDFDIDAAWKRARTAQIAGTKVLEFAPEDHFLALTLHASKHFWAKLIWLVDLAQLIGSNPAFDWEALADRARAMRAECLVSIAIDLLRDVMELPSSDLPPISSVEGSHSVYSLARSNLYRDQPDIEGLKRYWFFLRARDSAGDALRQVFRHAFRPSSGEWSKTSVSLPAAAYLPSHLWRLVAKFFRLAYHPHGPKE
jgi:hypothetical protein